MVKLVNETGQHKYPCYSTRLLWVQCYCCS